MKKILILNGPNLNLLGSRETDVYGEKSLNDIKQICEEKCNLIKLSCVFIQSNSEGELISSIQSTENDFEGLIINPSKSFSTDCIKFINSPSLLL